MSFIDCIAVGNPGSDEQRKDTLRRVVECAVEGLEGKTSHIGETVSDLTRHLQSSKISISDYVDSQQIFGVQIDAQLSDYYRELVGTEFRKRIEAALGKTLII